MHNAPVDFILTQGLFTTLDPGVEDPEAVAIAAGRFAAVGDFDDLIGEAGPATRIIDLGGRRAIPSPIRSPIHLSMAGARVVRDAGAQDFAALDPWGAMAWLVSGDDKLSRIRALQLWIEANDPVSMETGAGGVIKVGRSANLIVLSADFMTVPEAQILDIHSVLVLVEGRVVQGTGPFQALVSDPGRRRFDEPSVRVQGAASPVKGRGA